MEAIEDAIPWSSPDSRYALLFTETDVQLFYVSHDGYSQGMRGYLRFTPPQKAKVYQVFMADEGYGVLAELPPALS